MQKLETRERSRHRERGADTQREAERGRHGGGAKIGREAYREKQTER